MAFPLAAYGLSYWLPTIVKGFGVSNTANGFINIIPWVLVAACLVVQSAHGRQVAARKTLFIVGPALIGAACLVLSVYVPGNTLQVRLPVRRGGRHLRRRSRCCGVCRRNS